MLFLFWPLECHRKPEILLDNPDKETCSHNGPPVNTLFFLLSGKILLTSNFQVGLVEFLLKADRWCKNDTGKRDTEAKDRRKVGLTWQLLDVGGQQFGFLLLVALLCDVT